LKKLTSLHEIEKITNGDKQTMKELLEIFMKEASVQIQGLHDCHQNTNWNELKKTAHKVKSSLLLIGMGIYKPIAEDLENSAGADPEKTKKQVTELTDVYSKAIDELKIKIKELS